jgi:hypothetical protein
MIGGCSSSIIIRPVVIIVVTLEEAPSWTD